jgi:hypothetical protein
MTRFALAVVAVALAIAGRAAAAVAPEGRLELRSPLLAAPAPAGEEPQARAGAVAGLGDLRLRLAGEVAPDEGGGGASGTDVLGFLVGLFIGLGLGHFIIGDFDHGVLFLVLELVLLGAGGGLLIIGTNAVVFLAGAPLLFLLVRIWEVVDLAQRTFGRGGGGGDGVPEPATLPEPAPDLVPAARVPLLSVQF